MVLPLPEEPISDDTHEKTRPDVAPTVHDAAPAASNDTPNDKESSAVISGLETAESKTTTQELQYEGWCAYARVFKYSGRKERCLQAIGIVAAVASGVGVAVQNIVFGSFITTSTDFVSGKSTSTDLRRDASRLALYFVYIAIARFVLSYTYNVCLTLAAWRTVREIRHTYMKAALKQSIGYYDKGESGSIATQATSNGILIQRGTSEKLGLVFQGLAAFLASFIIAFVTQWKLTLMLLCMAIVIIGAMAVVGAIDSEHETVILKILMNANAFAEGVLGSIRTTHAFEMRSRLVKKFDQFLVKAHLEGRKLSLLFGLLFSTEYTVMYLGFALGFWQGVRMIARGEVTEPGDVFTVLLSVVIGTISITAVTPYIVEFSRASTAAGQLFRLIDTVSDIDPFNQEGERPDSIQGDIHLKNVTFAYPTRPETKVLEDFTLHVPQGKITALVGQSGSGKSTIVGLLERWYNPLSGQITIDGLAIDTLNLRWLRTNIRLVQQEPVLFQGTVFDNIAFGLMGSTWENASLEDKTRLVQEAAKIAFAHEFILDLPQGYETDIGQRGSLLSGGQKQRVAIARSIVSQPSVLLLDEATSALDPHAEGIVQKALDEAAKGRTTIVIAHKLATIKKADNIVVMKKGHIIEQGTHEQLVANDHVYAQLVRIQDLSVPTVDDDDGQTRSPSSSDNENIKESRAGDIENTLGLVKSLHQYDSNTQQNLSRLENRDDYDHHRKLGLTSVVFRLFRTTPEVRYWIITMVIGCVMATGIFPAQAILMSKVVNVFTLPEDRMRNRGDFFATMFIVLAAGALVSYFTLGFASNRIAQVFSHKYRRMMFHHILRQDIQFFDRKENSTGALAAKLDSNPTSIYELMGVNIGLIFIALLNVVACSVVALAFSWKLGLVVMLCGFPPLLGAGWFKVRLDMRLNHIISRKEAKSAAIASEAVAAIRTVSSLTLEQSVLDRYTEELNQSVVGCFKYLLFVNVFFGLTQCLEYLFLALGFWYGCRLVSLGEVSLNDFFVSFMAVFLSAQATAQFFVFSTSITAGQNAANYAFWLEELEPVVRETTQNKNRVHDFNDGDESNHNVALVNTRFSYPLRPETQVLRDVNLEVQPGQFMAVVGASGCGKSTVVSLLERYYDPTSGSVRIGDDALSDLNPRLYRREVALVQQEPTLFQGTIRENISLGMDNLSEDAVYCDLRMVKKAKTKELELSTQARDTISDAQVEEALRAANAWDFVVSLPEGTNTQVGSSGSQLSGGQRQRIAIARALVRNPRILLLDEATSALDTESEKVVQNALSEAAQAGNNRITIAIAHRLSTIRDADVICVFLGGKIVEKGTHEELIALGGLYLQMCDAQNLD